LNAEWWNATPFLRQDARSLFWPYSLVARARATRNSGGAVLSSTSGFVAAIASAAVSASIRDEGNIAREGPSDFRRLLMRMAFVRADELALNASRSRSVKRRTVFDNADCLCGSFHSISKLRVGPRPTSFASPTMRRDGRHCTSTS